MMQTDFSPASADRKDADGTRSDAAAHLITIRALLRAKVGHDFSQYKEKTLVRRIQRRMQVLRLDTVPAYIARLKEEPNEVELLFRELLLVGAVESTRLDNRFSFLHPAGFMPMAGFGQWQRIAVVTVGGER